MSAVKRVARKVTNTLGRLFRSPSVVVNDNSQEVANAINKQAEDERKAKDAAELKETREKEFKEKVEADQKALENGKATGTTETKESDLATSGLNEVNVDFSKTLRDEEEEKKKKDAFLSFMSSSR